MALPHFILLPGLHGTDALWPPLLGAMPREVPRTVVVYPRDKVLSWDDYLALIEAATPVAGELVVLGESFSGPLAVELAARHRHRVRGVVLSASFVTSPWPRIACRATGLCARYALGPMMLVRGLMPDRLADATVGRAANDALRDVSGGVVESRLRLISECDVRAALGQLACPIVYLQATHDIVVKPRSLRQIRRLHRDVRVTRLRSSHLILQRCPRQAWEAMSVLLK